MPRIETAASRITIRSLAELEDTAPRAPDLATFLSRAASGVVDYLLFALFDLLWNICLGAALGLLTDGVWTAFRDNYSTGAGLWQQFLIQDGAVIIAALIFVVGIGWFGQTPGKWLLGIKAVRPGHERVGLSRALLRVAILYWMWISMQTQEVITTVLPAATPVVNGLTIAGAVGFLVSVALVAFTTRRRGLHDLVAGTVVVSLPRKRKRGAAQRKATPQ